MWLIVGLGNPGRKYARTRHNVGFMVIEELSGKLDISLRDRETYAAGKGSVEGTDILLLEPLTFMNKSGYAVQSVVKKYSLPPEKIIVVHDDIDMETARLKIRERGSSGGHRGIESIIENLGTPDFLRVKVGIGRGEGIPAEEYVLSTFRKEELPLIKDAVKNAADAVVAVITEGAKRAMNRYN